MSRTKKRPKFAVCIANDGCDDLQVWKLYRVLPDRAAEGEDHLRIVDDSGEDYLYPSYRFVAAEFSAAVEEKLLAANSSLA